MAKNTGTELTATNDIVGGTDVTGVMVGGKLIRVIGAISVPTLKHETNQTIAIRFDQPITQKINEKKVKVVVGGETVDATENVTINVVRVTELASMKTFTYVVNAMTKSDLEEAEPNQSYVGKWYALRKGQTVEGKRYKRVEIVRIDPEFDGDDADVDTQG